MGIMITVGASVLLVLAGLLTMTVALRHRSGMPPVSSQPGYRLPANHVGGRCRCGKGMLQIAWQHGRGNVLGCNRYPDCRLAYTITGAPLEDSPSERFLQFR